MERLTPQEHLYQLWMIYTAKNEVSGFENFMAYFKETYQEFIDCEFKHLSEGLSSEGPHLSRLPDGILEVLGNKLQQCSDQFICAFDMEALSLAKSVLECLIILCRNYDNIPLVASCEFVGHTVTIASSIIEKICSNADNCDIDPLLSFIIHTLHWFECLYDPYFVWRKRLKGWTVDKSRQKFKPAFLHVAVVPYFHECFQNPHLPLDIQLRLLHLFGGIMSGAQCNALKVICPATLDVLLKVLSQRSNDGLINQLKEDLRNLKNLVLKCVVRLVHVIHCCSPDQRQVEVSQAMEGYMQVMLNISVDETLGAELQLNLINTINEMLSCRDRDALQVILVSAGTFDSFVSLLQKTPLTGFDAQKLAISVLKVMNAVLAGSSNAKEKFKNKVGYKKFVDALKSLGQPSVELLKTVLELVVEGEFDGSTKPVRNIQAALMLIQWLPDIQSHDLQVWLSENLHRICSYGHNNKMRCCTEGMIGVIINVLNRAKQINPNAVGNLISLLELLGTHSVTAPELKQFIGLLKLDEEGNQNMYASRLMRAMSTMARRDGKDGALYFFNIQKPGDGLTIPIIKKWPGAAFSFHSWFCLDTNVNISDFAVIDPTLYRRQLYCFSSQSGCGFEAFFTSECQLVIAVYNRKEYSTATVGGYYFNDNMWHCVDIIHTCSRRPFTTSQLYVYIDGQLKLNVQLKFPNLSEPLTVCRVGSPGLKSTENFFGHPHVSPVIKKRTSPLKFFFHNPSKAAVSESGVVNHQTDRQDDIWGPQISLQGQMGSVSAFHDALSASHVKLLYNNGPNNMTIFTEDPDLSDLNGKLFFYYNAKASKGSHCIDLSSQHNNGQLSGQRCATYDIKDIINCVGGVTVLFPILEQVNATSPSSASSLDILGLDGLEARDDWVVVPTTAATDAKLEVNQVAGFFTVLKLLLQTKVINQDVFIRGNAAAAIGALLQKVDANLIDVHVLMAVQLFVEAAMMSNRTMLNHLYQYVLFDFRVWSRSEFPVRIGHIQYLSTIIKDDKKFFRRKYGVQYTLDVIRTYYSGDNGLSDEDVKTIRASLFGLIKYFVFKDITFEEVQQIMYFIISVKDENSLIDCFDMLLSLLETKRTDQLFLLLFEQDMAELLYVLLKYKNYTSPFYEKILRILYVLNKTEKVYDKNKARLRLYDIGFSGFISQMQTCEVTVSIVKLFIEQIITADYAQTYNNLLSVLGLVHESSIDVKLETSRQLLSLLVTRPAAAKQIIKHVGWQEMVTKLLIKQPRKSLTENNQTQQSGDMNPAFNIPVTSVCENGSCIHSADIVDIGYVPLRRASMPVRPKSLEFLDASVGIKTPSTPLFIAAKQFEDLGCSDDEKSKSMSRSSSASAEELSAIAQRVEKQNSLTNLGDVADTLDGFLSPMRRNSIAQGEHFQKALDNLGIHKVYIDDETAEEVEELCQNLLIVLLTLMWKGIEGSDKNAWKERSMIFSWLDRTMEQYELVKPRNELTRKLYEMMLHCCCSDIRDSAQAVAAHTENALELIRNVKYFLTDEPTKQPDRYNERLLEDVMALLDILGVWDTTGQIWTEMVHMGLNILLSFASHTNLELCAVATAKLHSLIHTKLISSSAEASYLIGNLHIILVKAVEENTDNYSFLIPVLKALIEKSRDLLNLSVHLPTIPPTSLSPTFFDDFRNYIHTEEWRSFVDHYILPQLNHFSECSFEESRVSMKDFFDECHETAMVNMHKRNRERGESKLKFERQIMEVFQSKSGHENRRYQNVLVQLKNQHITTLKHWVATKRFFTGDRGAWTERKTGLIHWKLSTHENFSRMRVKLIENFNFNPHTEASQLRDNITIGAHNNGDQVDGQELVRHMSLAKEALVAKENMGDDTLGDEEWNAISSSGSTTEYSDKEKLVLTEECDFVTLCEVIKGRLEVTTTHIYFFDNSSNKEASSEDFKWALSQLREIHFRRYNLRRSALELFLIDQTSYFLNFQKQARNKVYSKILSLRPPHLVYHGTRSPADLLKASGLTQKWVTREISNFEYLIQLNTIAGRTLNDLSQYPVFPWILCDYESVELDLTNEAIYRDLSRPIGILNPRSEEEVRDKYETFEDPSGTIEKFHYGTHYSNAAGVMHYMIRMEPFTTLHIELQGGRFDVADRQFNSMPGSWKSLIENPNDLKELIPEFFYLPEFLINMNGFDLGKLQGSKDVVNNVELPNWARTPEEFIYKHRQALESEYVSTNLHNWIDLIFGYKQKGPAAVEALNVFYYCTYEGAVDLDAIKDPKERTSLEGMINNFGQTPCQLMKDPHPKRMSFDEWVAKAIKLDKQLNIFYFLNQLKVYFVEVSSDTDPVIFLNIPRNQIRSIIQQGMHDSLITVTESGIIGINGWLPYDKSITNYFTFEKDPSFVTGKAKKVLSIPFAPGLKIQSKLFATSHDGKLLFSGGHWDNSLQVYQLSKGRRINHVIRHIDVVTCLSLDHSGNHLITGSRDMTCMIWEVLQQSGTSNNINTRPMQILYGHDSEITDVHISTQLDMAVSASQDGTVIIHTVRKGLYMHTLRPPCDNISNTLTIPQISVSEVGHIVIFAQERDSDGAIVNNMLHLYSINGKALYFHQLTCDLNYMMISGDHLLLGDSHGQVTIMETFRLQVCTVIPLHVPITNIIVCPGQSHLLISLVDGKIIIIGIKNKVEAKRFMF